jgi:hypothetical protein
MNECRSAEQYNKITPRHADLPEAQEVVVSFKSSTSKQALGGF